MAKREQHLEARRLRRVEGYSVREIAQVLTVSKSTVSKWVQDIELTPAQIARLEANCRNGSERGLLRSNESRRKAGVIRREAQRQEGIRLAQQSESFRLLCMAYWGEGTKAKNRFCFTNSDPGFIVCVARFLNELGFWDKAVLEVNVYQDGGVDDSGLKAFWTTQSPLLPEIKIWRFKRAGEKTRGVVQRTTGIARIIIHSTRLIQMIYGGIDHLRS